jgi:hypothetical protein
MTYQASRGARLGRPLSSAHRHYLILEQGLGGAIVNFAINGAIAWAMFRSAASVPLWGAQSIAGDTFATAFLLPFITCLVVTPLVRRRVRSGRVPALEWRRAAHPVLGRLPTTAVRRALALGAVCALAVAPPALWALAALDVTPMSFGHFLAFKATSAAALGAVVTPLVGLCVLGDAEAPSETRAIAACRGDPRGAGEVPCASERVPGTHEPEEGEERWTRARG